MRQPRLHVVTVLLAATLAGCGRDAVGPPASRPAPPIAQAARALLSAQYAAWVAADARRHARTAPLPQRAPLTDGHVSRREYVAATRAAIACLRRAPVGLVVTPAHAAPGGELHYQWRPRTPPSRGDGYAATARAAFVRCESTYAGEVARIYANQRVIPADHRPATLQRLAACLRADGVAVARAPSMPRLLTSLDADRSGRSQRCVDRYFDLFRVPAA